MSDETDYSIVYQGPLEKPSKADPPPVDLETVFADLASHVQTVLAGYNVGRALAHAKTEPVADDVISGAILTVTKGKPTVGTEELLRSGFSIGASVKPRSSGTLTLSISKRLAKAVVNSVAKSTSCRVVISNQKKFTSDLSKGFLTIPYQAEERSGMKITRTVISPASAKEFVNSVDKACRHKVTDPAALLRVSKDTHSALARSRVETRMNTSGPVRITVDVPPMVKDFLTNRTSLRLSEVQAARPTLVAAIWDLDANVEWLSAIVNVMNRSQNAVRFYTLDAPVPAGLLSRPRKVQEWASAQTRAQGGRLSATAKKSIKPLTLIDSDFYRIGKTVRKNLPVPIDVLIGVTPAWIAGKDENGRPYFDYCTRSSGRMVLVTTTDLRQNSQHGQRPFEVAVGLSIVTQLLVAVNPKLGFHSPRKGSDCVFEEPTADEWWRRLHDLTAEETCLSQMKVGHRAALNQILAAFRQYQRPL